MASSPSTFERTEKHVTQSLKEHPDSTQAFSKELHDLQKSESPSAFKQDLGKLNDNLHKQGLLPGLQIVENEKTHDFDLKQSSQSLVEGAQKTLANPNASAAEKLSSVENLSHNGIKNIQVADSNGKMRDYSIETQKSGKHEMVHLYGKDENGQSQIALRGIDNGDGTFSQEKDRHGRNIGFQGSNWNESGHGKSNVGTVRDSAPQASRPAENQQPPENPKPADSAKPIESARPAEPIQPSTGADRSLKPTSGGAAPGAIDRSQFDAQLNDPKVMAAFAGRMNSEVGSQGPAAQQAFAEEIMNRAASRNQTLMQALSGSYYPTHHPGHSTNPQYVEAITNAWKNGTDTTHGATGNASGRVGFGARGGHYDDQHQWVATNQTANIGGERFGHEQVDIDRGWLDKYESLKRYS